MAKAADLAESVIQAARLCRAHRAQQLKELGLYAGQDSLLKHLAEKDGQTMGSLASNLGVRPPTVTKMVTRMAGQGILRRQSSAQDSRQNHVFLTETGHALAHTIDKSWRTAADQSFANLTDKDEKRLRKILTKLLTDSDSGERRKKKEKIRS